MKENSRLLKLKEEVNEIIEELLEDYELETTDINNFIYAAAPIMTPTMNQPSKRSLSRRNENFWKIRMQREISNWRKEVHSVEQKSIGLKFSKSRTGSHVTGLPS